MYVDCTKGKIYTIMELAPGQELQQIIEREAPFEGNALSFKEEI